MHRVALTATHSTALSMSASSNMIMGLLPPSSMEAGLKFWAAATFTARPVVTLPVKATLATPGWELREHNFTSHAMCQQ